MTMRWWRRGLLAPMLAALTLGMAIQDIPEGLALSLPLRRFGLSRARSFFYGQLSGIVEPLGALVGAVAIGLSEARSKGAKVPRRKK